MSSANLVTLSLDDARERVHVRVPMLFEQGRFLAFKEALMGVADFDRDLRRNAAPVDRLATLTRRLRDAGFDVDLSPEARETLQKFSAAQMFDLQRVRERITTIDEEFKKRTGGGLYGFQKLGSEWVTLRHAALIADQMGLGKLSGVSEPVLTPSGWRTMGALRVGDEVIGANGKPTRVAGVFPQGVKQLYRVTMNDGAWTRAGAEHLWRVQTASDRSTGRPGRVMKTAEIMDAGLRMTPSSGRKEGNLRWFVPVVAPVHFVHRELPIEPYVLGALIANGCLTKSIAHSGSDEQRAILGPLLEVHERVRLKATVDPPTYNLVRVDEDSQYNPLRVKLDRLGLCCVSYEKRIPPEYLVGSIEQRLALLQGLLDNDGTVSKDGITTEYNTTSPQLARDVLDLVRSLGGVAWMSTRVPKYTYKGEQLEGRLDHRVRMTLPKEFNPFRVVTKRDRYAPPTKYPPAHAIASIDPCGEEESVCIRVAASDSLYVTRDYIVTHNTVQLIAAIPLNAPVVVVAPSSIKGVWVEQISRWRPYLKTSVLKGRKSFRWPTRGEILITSYEILPELHDVSGVKGRRCHGYLDPQECTGCAVAPGWGGGRIQAVKAKGRHLPTCTGKIAPAPCPGCSPVLDEVPDGTVIIVDEAHLLKNAKSARAKKYARLVQVVLGKNGRSWGATGTPLENHPRDLWNVLQVLGLAKESFGSFSNYVTIFRAKPKFKDNIVVGYDWPALTPEDSEKIRPHLQRVMLRRLRDEVLDLPDKMYQDVEVELDRRTYVQCEAFVKQAGGLARMVEVIEKSKGESFGIQGLSELRQKLAVAKIPAMMELVESYEEQEEPLVVFSVHRAPIEALKGRPGWGIIMGGESKDAAKIAEDFQNGKLVGIAMTLSGGMGLTLTRAAHMLRVDHDWRPTMDEQVEDRLMRIGQTRKVLIKTLVASHPLEQRIMDLHAKKRGFVSASVDAAAARVVDQTGSMVDEEVRQIQEAAAQGRVIRRVAKDSDEQRAVEQVLSLAFERRSDERLAASLGEQAQTIGLSEAQWALVKKVVSRGRAKADSKTESQEDAV